MRYCINCGNELGEGCFCDRCGTNNDQTNTRMDVKNVEIKKSMNICGILHWASIILFSIGSLILFKECVKNAGDKVALDYLYQGNFILSIVYFIFGMWGIIPSVIFILTGRKTQNKHIVGMAIIMIIAMVALAIIYLLTRGASGMIRIISIVFVPYYARLSKIIILEALTVITGIAALRLKK